MIVTMQTLADEHRLILEARHHDPFAVLGRHPLGEGEQITVFCPGAAEVAIESEQGLLPMERLYHSDLFRWQGSAALAPHYQVVLDDGFGHQQRRYDPYSFPPSLSDFDLHLFAEGRHHQAFKVMGSHPHSIDGIEGVLFATWAPNAERVSVVGDFNRWDGRCHPMRSRGGNGIWELFIPGLQAGTLYKFELRNRAIGQVFLKADPYGRSFELRPSTAAIVAGEDHYDWQDQAWMQARAEAAWLHSPMAVYEVHLGSWQKNEQGHFLNYRELGRRLVAYVQELGFTHIELLPVTEHPLDASWGYQTTGYFAPSSRFGSPEDLRYLIDLCHQHNIGVILDWVPAHFPRDEHALARFDGTPLYEHEDPRRGEHRDWGTLIFNYGRNEVRSFLISSACYWLEHFHIDGLRVDAVASMLYLDYSRQAQDWLPNIHGGREHLEAIDFLRELNTVVHQDYPGALTMAEESTSWPMVSRPIEQGGLGFSMKWNMGWMNDTLDYIHHDPIHRRYHHNQLTFGLLYAFTENFILPFSHDEVVHMKRSMLYKMPGDEWQQFANLRLLYLYMYTMPGKKLLFMGNEFGQGGEWDHARSLDWYVLDYPYHQGVQRLVADLNRVYRDYPALHSHDFDAGGFAWIDCNDAEHSRLVYERRSEHELALIVLNFTPVPQPGYRVGVPLPGHYEVLINSDSMFYGGSNTGDGDSLATEHTPWMGQAHSLSLTLPPLGGVLLHHVRA